MDTIDATTAEIIQYSHNQFKIGDFGYHKIWVSNFEPNILKTGNKQTQIIFYILNHMDRENIVYKTQEEIAQVVNATTKTVRECLKTLTAHTNDEPPFMVRIGQSKYRVNPDVIYIGACNKRSEVVERFEREVRKVRK